MSTPTTRKALMDKITSLGSTEHAEIFRILKKYGVPHTQNQNGVFVNITTVSDEIVKEVSDFTTFCFRNNKELEEYDKRLNQCKLYQNLDCMADNVENEDLGDLNPTKILQKQAHVLQVQQPNSSMQRYLESLENSMDNQGRRHQVAGSTKFNAARKKYSKRVMADVTRTRGGADVDTTTHELKSEQYILV